jgi:mono/diheme cytochrome c family protein
MRTFSIIIAVLATGWATVGFAKTPTQRAIDESHPGYEVYRSYCAVCHGVFADGNGPVAPALATPPEDLSQLFKRYGSPLRSKELAQVIDGRLMARSHGTSDMPVWGDRLYQGPHDSQQVEQVRRGTILRIIEYLNSIQAGPDAGEKAAQ